jgi:hypothetical protein
VSAEAIMLPPFQTPHSMIAPEMFLATTYRVASMSACTRSGVVIVNGRTLSQIAISAGVKSRGYLSISTLRRISRTIRFL